MHWFIASVRNELAAGPARRADHPMALVHRLAKGARIVSGDSPLNYNLFFNKQMPMHLLFNISETKQKHTEKIRPCILWSYNKSIQEVLHYEQRTRLSVDRCSRFLGTNICRSCW